VCNRRAINILAKLWISSEIPRLEGTQV
jgi:hypothetical protein